MTEEKFRELLLENNKHTEEKFKSMLIENNKHTEEKFKSMLIENNKHTEEKFKNMLLENNKNIVQELTQKIDNLDRNINGKLAVLEKNYGDKISVIFDKIQAIDDRMTINEKEKQKYAKMLENHDALLYSHEVRVSKLEDKINSI